MSVMEVDNCLNRGFALNKLAGFNDFERRGADLNHLEPLGRLKKTCTPGCIQAVWRFRGCLRCRRPIFDDSILLPGVVTANKAF